MMHNVMTLEEARQYIQALDLNYIVDTMCSDQYPLPRWSLLDAKACCQRYKNFLFLFKKHPQEPLVPTREIDEFWHNHILYTKNYLHDCMMIYGYYLHHEPATPNDHPESLVSLYQKTKEYYFQEFNEPLSLYRR